MNKDLRFGLTFLTSPGEAAEACRDEKNAGPALRVYAAFTLLYLLFFWLKPFDFPDKHAAFPREAQNLFFWFRVMLWQPPLEAAWIVALFCLVGWFREGSMAVKLTAGVAWTATPFIVMAFYSSGQLGRSGLALGSLCWMAGFIPFLRKGQRSEWLPLAGFMLGLNAIGIALLVPMTLAVALRESSLFMGVQACGGLWMLGAGTLGLRRLTGLRMSRAFMAVMLSMFFQIAFAFTLHLLGLVPKEILKALLYA